MKLCTCVFDGVTSRGLGETGHKLVIFWIILSRWLELISQNFANDWILSCLKLWVCLVCSCVYAFVLLDRYFLSPSINKYTN